MIPRIKTIKTLPSYQLEVTFDDNKRVLYDVNDDIQNIDDFKSLHTIKGLWESFQLDDSRTVIFWNDRIDIPSDILYEYGKCLDK